MKSRHLDKYISRIIEGFDTVHNLKTDTAALDRRDAERVPLDAAVSYVSDARMGLTRGEGRLEDLSKTGCKIIGPLLMVGTMATLVIDFNDDKAPFCITGAEVTWSDGESFGVRFPKLKAEDRQRLQELVLRFATLKGRSEDHRPFDWRKFVPLTCNAQAGQHDFITSPPRKEWSVGQRPGDFH